MDLVNQRRSSMHVIQEMLRAAQKGTRKTRMMYTCNLSLQQTNKYIDWLEKKGLIEENGEERIFKTTEKGKQLVRKFREMEELLADPSFPNPQHKR